MSVDDWTGDEAIKAHLDKYGVFEEAERLLDEVYCIEGCGRLATHERLISIDDRDVTGDGEQFNEIVELVCAAHQ